MNGFLVPFGSESHLPVRLQRQMDREISVVRARGAVQAAHEVAKVALIEEVASRSLMAASNISSIEGVLMERDPHAEARLRHIADAGAAGLGAIVLRLGERLR